MGKYQDMAGQTPGSGLRHPRVEVSHCSRCCPNEGMREKPPELLEHPSVHYVPPPAFAYARITIDDCVLCQGTHAEVEALALSQDARWILAPFTNIYLCPVAQANVLVHSVTQLAQVAPPLLSLPEVAAAVCVRVKP